MLPDVGEKHVDISPNVYAWCLNASDNLWYHVEPSINIDDTKAGGHRIANIVVATELEPESQET